MKQRIRIKKPDNVRAKEESFKSRDNSGLKIKTRLPIPRGERA